MSEKYKLFNLKKRLLDDYNEYINQNIDEPMEIQYGSIRYIGDAREENEMERIIRTLKCKQNLKIKSSFFHINYNLEKLENTSIIESDDNFYHAGYLEYLMCAWENNLGIEIGPWNLWNIILWTLKEYNKRSSEKFKSLWMKDENLDKIIYNNDSENFNIKDIFKLLSNNIPSETLDALVFDFDNSPNNYIESVYGLIGDLYQNYSKVQIYYCEITDFRIVGDKSEWDLLLNQINKISNLYEKYDDYNINKYFSQLKNYINDCISNINNKDYWYDFYSVKNCGSASQQEIHGHIKNLFLDKNYNILVEQLPKIISKFPYEKINSRKSISKHNFTSGVLSSHIDKDNILVPEFHYWNSVYDLDDLILNQEEEKSNNDIIKCLEILNSFSRSPVFHKPIHDKSFLESFQLSHWILNDTTVDDFIKIQKLTLGNINEDKAKQFFLEKKEKFKNKNHIDFYNELIDMCDEKISKRGNFWFNSTNNYCSKDFTYLSTETWVRGRKKQKKEDIQLICNNMDLILKTINAEYNKNKNIIRNQSVTQFMYYIIYSSFNEDIYFSFINSLSERIDVDDDPISYVSYNLISTLLNSTKSEISYDFIKNNNFIFHQQNNTIISRYISILIITELLKKLPKNTIEALNKKFDPENYTIIEDFINQSKKTNIECGKNNIYDVMDFLLKPNNTIKIPSNLYASYEISNIYFSGVENYHININHLNLLTNKKLSKSNLTIRINNNNQLCLVDDPKYVNESLIDNLPNNDYKKLQDYKLINNFLKDMKQFGSKFHNNIETICNEVRQNKFKIYEKSYFNFWTMEYAFDNELNHSSLHDYIDNNKWISGIEKQNKLFDKYFENFDEIYEFMYFNDINGLLFKNFIFWTLNPKLINLFLNLYKKKPYDLNYSSNNHDLFDYYLFDYSNNVNSKDYIYCICNLLLNYIKSHYISFNVSMKIMDEILINNNDKIDDIYKYLLTVLESYLNYYFNSNSNNHYMNNQYISEIYELEGNFRILVDFIYLIYNNNNHLNPEFDNNYLSKLVSKYSKKEFKYEELDKILSFKRFKQMYA